MFSIRTSSQEMGVRGLLFDWFFGGWGGLGGGSMVQLNMFHNFTILAKEVTVNRS